jgi:hypothetical protein
MTVAVNACDLGVRDAAHLAAYLVRCNPAGRAMLQ